MKRLTLAIPAILILCLLSFKQHYNSKVLYNVIDLETSEAFIASGPTGYIKNDSVWILSDGSIDVQDTSNNSMMAVIVNRYHK